MGLDNDNRRRETLREAVRRWNDDRQPKDHPSAEVVEAYLSGRLPAEEISRLRDHLADCRRCGRWLLDLVELRELEGDTTVEDAAVEEDWRRLLDRITD